MAKKKSIEEVLEAKVEAFLTPRLAKLIANADDCEEVVEIIIAKIQERIDDFIIGDLERDEKGFKDYSLIE